MHMLECLQGYISVVGHLVLANCMRHCTSFPSLQSLIRQRLKAKFGAVETGSLLCISNPERKVVKSNIAPRAFRLQWVEAEGCGSILYAMTAGLYIQRMIYRGLVHLNSALWIKHAGSLNLHFEPRPRHGLTQIQRSQSWGV